ncbi:Uncharacterized conserved protein, DUF302 family [Atopostipes suicloacalis DSM 15692]|uniref:Uncharacterized conserved protein, DUF302 family n=1 Tax=Atopostipes suicloacalis DSM 15692 TaxID=1121025 RepID=A0A1M4S796_9LACT|nr:DUF302 domain-containing protein [Atopostipes suicloacalis]MDY5968096.1 DUF302 domain-containing protein [Sphaerochaetaceae bacterium]SHE28051.1 Uncharacterized conserved protein, DUF302 family [Atopostipes suicloacalis DSM 15692]
MNFKYEIKTNKSFQTAIEDITDSLKEREFGVLYQVNFKEKIEAKGLDFSTNFEVLEVCNPGQAKEVLEKSIEVGYFLPCKVVVYEKEGEVYIGLLKPTVLIGLLEDDCLKTIAEEVENTLKEAIQAVV